MKNFRIYFHLVLAVAAGFAFGLSLWESGWWKEGKDHFNFTAIAMAIMVIGQLGMMWEAIKDKRKVEK